MSEYLEKRYNLLCDLLGEDVPVWRLYAQLAFESKHYE